MLHSHIRRVLADQIEATGACLIFISELPRCRIQGVLADLEAVLVDGRLVDTDISVPFGVGEFVPWDYLAVRLQAVSAATVGRLIYY